MATASTIRPERLAILLALCLAGLAAVSGAGQFIITHAPDHVQFLAEGGDLPTSEVANVLSLALGFSLNKDLQWNGLASGNPFKRLKANVLVSVEGLEGGLLPLKHTAQYLTDVDDVEVNTETVVNQIQSSMGDNPLIVDFSSGNTLFDIKSYHPSLFHDVSATLDQIRAALKRVDSPISRLPLGELNATNEEDLVFLGELQLIQEIVTALKQNRAAIKSQSPDLFHFKITGYNRLLSAHGAQSQKVKDAIRVLKEFLNKVTEEFKELYSGNVMMEVVALPHTDEALRRKGRSLMQKPTKKPESQAIEESLNVAADYSADFPVIFNIIFWLIIVLIITIYGISYCMWNMDPGRDSIIYRMTEQRLKKD